MPNHRFVSLVTICVLLTGCAHGEGKSGSVAATPTTASAARGAELFATQCSACHGDRGIGARIGPSLLGEHGKKTEPEIRAIILDPEPPMPKLYPGTLSEQDVDDLTAYVESL